VGISGKIGTILRTLGSDIIHHSQDENLLLYPEEFVSEPKTAEELMSYLPTIDSEFNPRPEGKEWGEIGEIYPTNTRRIGMHFDGLGRGMHMEIKYDDEKSELSLTHKGYLVYRETMGDIDTYIPHDEWEGWVEKLWVLSRGIQRKQKEEEFKKKNEETDEIKESWLNSLMKKWGKV